MFRAIIFAAVFASAASLAVPAGAAAEGYEDYRQRQEDLTALSAIFGDLHHIRRYCEPRAEADVWRERMKTVIDLEAPLPEARQAMITAFNRAYRTAQRRYPTCNRRARDYAASQALRADAIIARLTTPLYEALEENQPLLLTETPQNGETQGPQNEQYR